MSENALNTVLTLPKSRISVSSEEVLKCSPTGEVIARHKLSSLTGATVKKYFDPFSIVFGIAGAALIYFPSQHVESEMLRWILIAIGVVLCILSIFGCYASKLVLVSRDGEIVYSTADDPEQIQGFAASLADMILEGRKS